MSDLQEKIIQWLTIFLMICAIGVAVVFFVFTYYELTSRAEVREICMSEYKNCMEGGKHE